MATARVAALEQDKPGLLGRWVYFLANFKMQGRFYGSLHNGLKDNYSGGAWCSGSGRTCFDCGVKAAWHCPLCDAWQFSPGPQFRLIGLRVSMPSLGRPTCHNKIID